MSQYIPPQKVAHEQYMQAKRRAYFEKENAPYLEKIKKQVEEDIPGETILESLMGLGFTAKHAVACLYRIKIEVLREREKAKA